MTSSELKSTIIRALEGEELSGYSIYKMLTVKGMETWPNHVYTLLVEMERKDGLLKSRWVGDRRKKREAPRKHLYTLSESGKGEYDNIVRGALGVLMERFFKENLAFEDLSFHIELAKETFGNLGKLSEDDPFRLVVASPSYHPLICFPKFYYALSDAYPRSTVYVVRNPWEKKPLQSRKNLTFLDGSRDEMPLRDDFADYVLLQGFPRSSTVAKTIGECVRVLKGDGCLFLEVPAILTAEQRVPHNTIFPEFVLKLFYELCGQDRTVRIEDVNKVLAASFGGVRRIETRGKVIFCAARKRAEPRLYALPSRNRSLVPARRR